MIVVHQKADENYPQRKILLNPLYILQVSPAERPKQDLYTGSFIYMWNIGVIEVVEYVADIAKLIEEDAKSRQLIPIQIPH